MINFAIKTAKFIAVFLLCSIMAMVGWEVLLKNRVYNCTDDLPLDYLQPGQWVHHPVTVVHVSTGRAMSEPDVIKKGWTETGLWCLWSLIIAGSVIVSVWAALVSRSWSFPSVQKGGQTSPSIESDERRIGSQRIEDGLALLVVNFL